VLAQQERPHASGGVTALVAVLDLDDLRAKVGKVQRAERSRPEVFERQDPYAGKGRGGGQVTVLSTGRRSIAGFPMIIRRDPVAACR
jgi:hypothetical protein